MTGTASPMTTDIAVRKTGARVETARSAQPAQAQAGLTLRAGQTRFDEQQRAALATLGIKKDAPQADLDVFLHVSQRMALDPFAKQIHLIYYRVNDAVWNSRTRQWDDNWVEKPSIQTGIAGFRVQRDRVAKREGLLIDYEDTVWYNASGEGFDVWLWDDPPTACRVAVKISDGRRFPATLRFNEFAKRAKSGQLTGRWRDSHSYQIEKCAEAAALRKAFPQDFAGLDLDAEIESDPDAPPPAAPVQRVTAEQIRQQRQTVTATAETVTPNASPAQPHPPSATPATPPQDAGEAPMPPLPGEEDSAPAVPDETAPGGPAAGTDPTTSGASYSARVPGSGSRAKTAGPSQSSPGGSATAPDEIDYDTPGTVTTPQITAIWTVLSNVYKFGSDEKEQARTVCAHIVNHDLESTKNLSRNEAKAILDTLGHWGHAATTSGEHPRDYLIATMAAQEDARDGEVPGE